MLAVFMFTAASAQSGLPKPAKGVKTRSTELLDNVIGANDADRLMLRDILLARYKKDLKGYGEFEEKIYGWCRHCVSSKLMQIPENIDCKNTLLLDRWANYLSGVRIPDGMWKEFELKEALTRVYVKGDGIHSISGRCAEQWYHYGICRRTLTRYWVGVQELMKTLKREDNESENQVQLRAIAMIKKCEKGRAPLLSPDETKLVLTFAAACKKVGMGVTRIALRAHCMGLLKAIGDAENDPVTKSRLLNAKVSKTWLEKQIKKYREDVGLSLIDRKTSKLSHNRAAANANYLNAELFGRIKEFFKKHGIDFDKGEKPEADQMYNGDEIGFDPTGKWHRVISFIWDVQNNMCAAGEKAPFWVTVWFITRADGEEFIEPCIIHQGQAGMVTEANIMLQTLDEHNKPQYVPENWLTHQTPSGYNDRDGFLKIAYHFVARVGRPDVKKFLFIDGHDSHFDADPAIS